MKKKYFLALMLAGALPKLVCAHTGHSEDFIIKALADKNDFHQMDNIEKLLPSPNKEKQDQQELIDQNNSILKMPANGYSVNPNYNYPIIENPENDYSEDFIIKALADNNALHQIPNIEKLPSLQNMEKEDQQELIDQNYSILKMPTNGYSVNHNYNYPIIENPENDYSEDFIIKALADNNALHQIPNIEKLPSLQNMEKEDQQELIDQESLKLAQKIDQEFDVLVKGDPQKKSLIKTFFTDKRVLIGLALAIPVGILMYQYGYGPMLKPLADLITPAANTVRSALVDLLSKAGQMPIDATKWIGGQLLNGVRKFPEITSKSFNWAGSQIANIISPLITSELPKRALIKEIGGDLGSWGATTIPIFAVKQLGKGLKEAVRRKAAKGVWNTSKAIVGGGAKLVGNKILKPIASAAFNYVLKPTASGVWDGTKFVGGKIWDGTGGKIWNATGAKIWQKRNNHEN